MNKSTLSILENINNLYLECKQKEKYWCNEIEKTNIESEKIFNRKMLCIYIGRSGALEKAIEIIRKLGD